MSFTVKLTEGGRFVIDRWLLLAIVVLLLVGFLMNLMATSNKLWDNTQSLVSISFAKPGVDIFSKVKMHALKVAIGLFFATAFFVIPTHRLRSLQVHWCLAGLTLLLFVWLFFHGIEVNGSKRWIRILGFQLSPSDFTRFTLILWLADFLARRKDELHIISHVLKAAFFIALAVVPIIFQPNLSTAVILCVIAAAMMWVAGINRKLTVVTFVLIAILGVVYIATASFRSTRAQVFLDPFKVYREYDALYQIDPATGTVIRSFAGPAWAFYGVAFDHLSKSIFLTMFRGLGT